MAGDEDMKAAAIPESVINDAWNKACAFWGATLDIAQPVDVARSERGESVAYIQLETRQVAYNSRWFLKRHILDCFPAVFAHELAHHMRYPQTLRVSAELTLMGNRVSPGLDWGMINLFLDLLVNEHVGRDPELRRELIKLYSAIAAESKDELYQAYLCVYECLWFGEADFGLPIKDASRALIRSFTDTFYQLPNIYEQFLYFLTFFMKYFDLPEPSAFVLDPLTGDSRLPTPEDFPVDGSWSKAMREAYEKAAQEGWGKSVSPPSSDEAYRELASVMGRLAGKGQPNAPQQAALRYYRQLIERAIDELPPRITGDKEPFEILSASEAWQYDDDPRSIDWLESTVRAGSLASATPYKREMLLEPMLEQTEVDLGVPDFETYLDTSGSMPNPVAAVNVMTLAALVLSTYAVRKGGRVHGVVYSSGPPIIAKDWMLEESVVQTFFLNYFGGGTDFPFSILKQRAQEYPGAHRIIISDSDLISNLNSVRIGKGSQAPAMLKLLSEAADRSRSLVLLLNGVTAEQLKAANLGALLTNPQIRFVPVRDPKAFAGIAAELGEALLGRI
ncbi:MAG: hypothetical protein U0136_07880 [Bdellovibrionota bacterium]